MTTTAMLTIIIPSGTIIIPSGTIIIPSKTIFTTTNTSVTTTNTAMTTLPLLTLNSAMSSYQTTIKFYYFNFFVLPRLFFKKFFQFFKVRLVLFPPPSLSPQTQHLSTLFSTVYFKFFNILKFYF